jgi:hypothetical protein
MFIEQNQLSVKRESSLSPEKQDLSLSEFGEKGHILSVTSITCLVSHYTIKS